MKVVILCGGLGTRLREETEFRPKPMIQIGEKPILWHIMKTYSAFGFQEFILCLGYKGEMIKEYFLNYPVLNNDFRIKFNEEKEIELLGDIHREDWSVTLVDTGRHALKGARLKRIEKYIGQEEFMVTYGDGLSNIDFKKLLKFHRSHKKIATLTGVHPLSRYGDLIVEDNRVKGINEKAKNPSGLINGGFFIFSHKIFKYLTNDDQCDLEIGPLEQLAKDGQLMVYQHNDFWACMDTMRDVGYLNKLWQDKAAPWKVWK